jgi:glycosyltransferase involved in cell wall biosynthesis
MRLLLVGAVENVDVSALASLPNVQFTGEVPYQRLPDYVRQYDVALLPYRPCEYGFASDPMKVWEYLSAGKPVVALRYPEIERLEEWVSLVSTHDEFVDAIRRELASDCDEKRVARQVLARENSWKQRCGELEQAVASDFLKVSVVSSATTNCLSLAPLDSIERLPYPRLSDPGGQRIG